LLSGIFGAGAGIDGAGRLPSVGRLASALLVGFGMCISACSYTFVSPLRYDNLSESAMIMLAVS
jgi:hypothetical protein